MLRSKCRSLRSIGRLVLEANLVTRHVQFKSSSLTAKTARQTVHVDLGKKPSGCVIWVFFDPASLRLDHYQFFGGGPRKLMPSLDEFPLAKHACHALERRHLARLRSRSRSIGPRTIL